MADQPGVAFDAALLATMLGLVRPPLPTRETASLAARLVRRPRAVAGPLRGLLGEGARVLRGRSELQPGRVDRRYADRAWQGNPLFRRVAQSHIAIAEALEAVLDRAELDPGTDYRLRLAAVNLVAALAPPNFPLTNPAAMKAVLDTGGGSLTLGARRLATDLRKPPRLPARSEPSGFTLGEGLAATPGAVVLRTPVMELLQYATTTDEVKREPMLVVPSLVNKYYLTDLSPGRSLVEHLIGQGYQTFHISWVNPGPEHRRFDLDTYVAAIVEALEAVSAITGIERSHVLGVCAGGQLLSIALAHLAALEQQERVASVALTVCVMDHSEPASPTGLLNRKTAERAMAEVDRKGIVDGRRLQTVARLAAAGGQHLVGLGGALPAGRRHPEARPLPLVRGHDEPARRARARPDGADAREPADQARLVQRARHPDRPRQGEDRRLHHCRVDRQPYTLEVLLPDDEHARLAQPLHAGPGRSPAGHPAPAGRPPGRLHHRRRDAARSRRLAGEGQAPRGQLVGALGRVARPPLHRHPPRSRGRWATTSTRRSSPPPAATSASASTEARGRRRPPFVEPAARAACPGYLAGMRRGIAAVVAGAVAGLGWLAAGAAGQGSPPVGASPTRTLRVPSETMLPTIPVGGTVETNDAAYLHMHPQIGTS